MIFIKPNGKSEQYGRLKSISAVEPPVWLVAVASSIRNSKVIDAEAENLSYSDIGGMVRKEERVVIFPTGSNPFGFVQQRHAAAELKKFLVGEGMVAENIEIWEKMVIDPSEVVINWELVKMEAYRSPNWLAWGREDKKYGATFTSISCPYSCQFCVVKDFYAMKYKKRAVKLAVDDIVRLFFKYGISNFKVMDEMFALDTRHVREFCDEVNKTGLGSKLNIWVYARIDTVTVEMLDIMRRGGVRWVAYGIESGNEDIRKSYGKGGFSNTKIKEVIKSTKAAGINIVGNYMFGFAEDSIDTMNETLGLAKELMCEYSNFYCYVDYGKKREQVDEVAQYSPKFKPEPTKYLTATDVVAFRDKAFMEYYTSQEYLEYMAKGFGRGVISEINEMTKVKVVRDGY
jgi:anaerobic magnesium-protoporphyrin IX monomethyl ester cyclase